MLKFQGKTYFSQQTGTIYLLATVLIVFHNTFHLPLTESETDGAQFYHPDRILTLVLEEPDDEVIRPPITGLLKSNVIDVVSVLCELLNFLSATQVCPNSSQSQASRWECFGFLTQDENW